jgi:hypothetical protein
LRLMSSIRLEETRSLAAAVEQSLNAYGLPL